jgi:DNA-binding NtrC family response regulator
MTKHTLLIIDDEPNILSSLKRVVEGEEREVYLAKDAEEGWKTLQEKGEMEVIICDNKLPGMLGVDFFIKVKRLYPDTIRILITGYPDLNSAMDAINKAHIWRYILKPIEVEELKTLIKQSFDYYRILKENRLLLQIARQQAEWLRVLKEKYPGMVGKEISGDMAYAMEEKHVSAIVEEFIKKYYPQEKTKDEGQGTKEKTA